MPAAALVFAGNFRNDASLTGGGTAQDEDLVIITDDADPLGTAESLTLALDVTPRGCGGASCFGQAVPLGLGSANQFDVDALDIVGSNDYILSFKETETLSTAVNNAPSLTVQDEDLVWVTDNGAGGLSANLLVDLTPITPTTGGSNNRSLEVDAVHSIDSDEVLVSFQRSKFNLGNGVGGVTTLPSVGREDLVRVTFDGAGTVTGLSHYLDDPSGHLAGLNLNGFTAGAGGLAGNFQYGTTSNNGGAWSNEDIILITIAENLAPGLLTNAEFIVIGASLIIDNGGLETSNLDGIDLLNADIPEPAPMALLGIGLSLLLYARRRRLAATAGL